MGSERRCIGFGDFEEVCGRVLNEDDLALNDAGLWCVRCERLRRAHLTEQFASITAAFSSTTGRQDGHGSKVDERALGVRWPCGCITMADARPSRMTAKDKRELADEIARGAEIVRATPDELRAMPHFLPVECPHEPKGWTRAA